MRLLHLSDLHIGKIVNAFNMIEDQRYALEGILALLKEKQVDAVVLAGDLYDKAAPSAEAVAVVDWFLTSVADLGVNLIGVPGNHDSAERVAYAQGILANQGVYFPPLFDGKVKRVVLEDNHGPVNFWLLPFLRPAAVRPFFEDAGIQTDYTRAIECALSTCELDHDSRNVLVAHQFVTAHGHDTKRSDSEINLGGLDNVDTSVFGAFDYVALGHVHRPQRIGRDTCRYAGSLLKYSFSEANHDKSAVLVELGAKKDNGSAPGECVSFELIEYPILRDLRKIKGPLEDILETAKDTGGSNDYLHVTLTDEFMKPDALNRIREFYPNVMSLEHERPSSTERQASKRSMPNPEKIDMEELFSRFFLEQTGSKLSELQQKLVNQAVSTSTKESKEGTR